MIPFRRKRGSEEEALFRAVSEVERHLRELPAARVPPEVLQEARERHNALFREEDPKEALALATALAERLARIRAVLDTPEPAALLAALLRHGAPSPSEDALTRGLTDPSLAHEAYTLLPLEGAALAAAEARREALPRLDEAIAELQDLAARADRMRTLLWRAGASELFLLFRHEASLLDDVLTVHLTRLRATRAGLMDAEVDPRALLALAKGYLAAETEHVLTRSDLTARVQALEANVAAWGPSGLDAALPLATALAEPLARIHRDAPDGGRRALQAVLSDSVVCADPEARGRVVAALVERLQRVPVDRWVSE